MSALSPALARSLDRLARGAHAFHRYAHHPLCGEYAGEVLRVGRRARVCRGCTLALAGAVAGAALGIAVAPGAILASSALPLALLAAAGASRDRGKLATRFLPAGLIAFAASGGILLLIASITIAIVLVRLYRRRGPDRSPCLLCPERLHEAPCRGFAPIVSRERAFQRFSRSLGT